MRGRTCSRSMVVFLPLAFAVLGCAHGTEPLDLTSPDPASDQRKIANYYSREAEFFRFKADELSQRIVLYEGLFGPDSEWVKGARLLEQFYKDSAEEQDRRASSHLGLAGQERSAPRARSVSP